MVRTVSLNVRGNDTPTYTLPQQRKKTNKLGITGGRTDGIREDGLVVEDVLGPVHEGVDILGRGKLRGALVTYAVFPEVLVSDFVKSGRFIIAVNNG
jgi:hypothetical protein